MVATIRARVEEHIGERVERRARAETDGNLSEITRHLLIYALPRMPVDYDPADDLDRLTTTSEDPTPCSDASA